MKHCWTNDPLSSRKVYHNIYDFRYTHNNINFVVNRLPRAFKFKAVKTGTAIKLRLYSEGVIIVLWTIYKVANVSKVSFIQYTHLLLFLWTWMWFFWLKQQNNSVHRDFVNFKLYLRNKFTKYLSQD